MLAVVRALSIGALVLGAVVPGAGVPRARAQDAPPETRDEAAALVQAGQTEPGIAIAIAPALGAPRVLCEPDCALELPRGPTRVGWRREGRDIEWQQQLWLDTDLRIDVVLEDRSDFRDVAYALLVTGGILLAASAIVGIATEPEPPDHGWFGERHGLVFAGIAGGIVLALGVPGVVIALAFEDDEPAIRTVPVDEAPPHDTPPPEAPPQPARDDAEEPRAGSPGSDRSAGVRSASP